MKIISKSARETLRIAAAVARSAQKGDLIFLNGRLGSGKTVFAKGIARGLGVDEKEVISPTFVIIREYTRGRIPLYHFDLYRLQGPSEAAPLALEEYFYGDGICVVEWPQRLGCLKEKEYLQINITMRDNERGLRVLEFVPRGKRYLRLLERVKK